MATLEISQRLRRFPFGRPHPNDSTKRGEGGEGKIEKRGKYPTVDSRCGSFEGLLSDLQRSLRVID